LKSIPWLVVLCLLAISCSAGGGSKNGAQPKAVPYSIAEKPCLALKRTEVEAALGSPVKEGSDPNLVGAGGQISIVGMKFCRFGAVKPAGPFMDVGISKAYARQAFEKYKNDPATRPIPVPGIGDAALWHEFAASHSLAVLKGDTVVGIDLEFVEKDQKQIAINLARKVLSRV